MIIGPPRNEHMGRTSCPHPRERRRCGSGGGGPAARGRWPLADVPSESASFEVAETRRGVDDPHDESHGGDRPDPNLRQPGPAARSGIPGGFLHALGTRQSSRARGLRRPAARSLRAVPAPRCPLPVGVLRPRRTPVEAGRGRHRLRPVGLPRFRAAPARAVTAGDGDGRGSSAGRPRQSLGACRACRSTSSTGRGPIPTGC